jgi:hypothetical protein
VHRSDGPGGVVNTGQRVRAERAWLDEANALVPGHWVSSVGQVVFAVPNPHNLLIRPLPEWAERLAGECPGYRFSMERHLGGVSAVGGRRNMSPFLWPRPAPLPTRRSARSSDAAFVSP